MKKILKLLGAILLVAVFVCVTLIAYLTIDEYKPDDVENVTISGNVGEMTKMGQEYTLMSWNIGYGALGDNANFFMDGGKDVYTADETRVRENLADIASWVDKYAPDFLLTQELDRNSSRSYFIDELERLNSEGTSDVFDYQNCFAPNFKVSFVPLPIPPIGRVLAGEATYSSKEMASAERVALPCPFTWPLRTFNLKRCLLVSRFPVEGTDRELVFVNLHLEAYDSGEGKIAQTNMLKELMNNEVSKGNYIIVAGDFNQTFSNVDLSKYPVLEGMWEAGIINIEEFGSSFSFLHDDTYPTCRSLDRSLTEVDNRNPENFQYYMIDGVIVSSNIQVNHVETVNTEFKCSDHNPMVVKFVLKSE
ncbi:endonuclease/exonuclease/phosphatase family protein [Butyrivibrio sp. VCB2006]|uniref:endonuclease/exonuclease/phosphatase family protein n=1 Tax=Butyrivibrio sp. VCB2006 TaxID=1280679 RepID=UPI0003F8F060|nr:endonuclease/exonuclease/phosphatase family protein [Butyrivibrio sp. VCB2006]